MKDGQPLSPRAKHRLRIAARFLRKGGHHFDDGNFYEVVLAVIQGLNGQQQMRLRNLTNWVEEYELSEVEHWGERHGRSRDRKAKPGQARKGRKRLPAQDSNKIEG